MLENPIILAALICFLLGLVLSGLARVVPGSTIASAVLPIIFLASYIITYQQVPPLSPDWINKQDFLHCVSGVASRIRTRLAAADCKLPQTTRGDHATVDRRLDRLSAFCQA